MTAPTGSLEGVVPRLGFGSAGLGDVSRELVFRLLDEWVSLGGTLIDTAAVYGGGASERQIGAWLRARDSRDRVVLLTKGGHPDAAWRTRLDAASIRADLDTSLERLGVDRIDIYMVHRDDPSVPVGEIVEMLGEHVARGVVGTLGASNWTPARVDDANAYADAHGLPRFAAVSNYFGLARPLRPILPGAVSSTDREARDWHARTGMPLIAWSAQSGGFFADDKAAKDVPVDTSRTYDSAANRERRERARIVAQRLGLSTPQVVLAWVLAQPFRPFAVIGPRRLHHLRAAWHATEVRLKPDDMRWLDGDELAE